MILAIGKPNGDEKKVFCLLKGLGPRYESFTTSMLKPPIPSYSDLIPLLQSHEAIKMAHSPSPYTQPHQTEAFVGQRISGGRGHGRGRFNTPQFSSHGRGFVQTEQNSSRPATGYRHNAGETSHTGHFQVKPQEINHSETQKNPQDGPRLECQICGKFGHGALKCWNRFNHAFQANDIPQALAAITLEDGQNSDWITDTGASTHITGDPGILENVIPYTGTDKVMVGDGNLLHISHIGNARIKAGSKPIILKNVLLVPNMKKNLISISQLTDDLSCLVEFSSKGFLIKDLKTRKILALGTKQGGLYILNDCHEALFSTRFKTTSETVWHKRLGHPQPLVVRFLNNKGLITVDGWNQSHFVCDSCQMSKSSRLPFVHSNNFSLEP